MDWNILMADYVISLPFSFDEYGRISTTDDQKLIWRDRVRLVLMTRFGERVMRPSFGSDLVNSLFETESVAIEMVKRTVTIAFNQLLNSLNLIEMNPVYDQTTGGLELSVTYSLPSGEIDSVSLKTAVFNRSGDILQEIPNV
jgi:uncharacterized protein